MRQRVENLNELIEDFDFEAWLDTEAIEYAIKPGRSGEQLNLKSCPRCGGSDWKVFINRDNGVGNCFHGSCADDPWFNKVSFIASYTKSGKGQAIGLIKDFCSEQGWRPRVESSRVEAPTVSELKLPESTELPVGTRNMKYLSNRGMTLEQTKKHGLRYCQNGFHSFYQGDEKKQQWFSGRIIIPILDLSGQLVTFQGRDVTGKADRKYLMATALPASGRFLYNGHNAVGSESITLCEGAFSVYGAERALEQAGIKSAVVGTFGKSLSTNLDAESQVTQLIALKRSGLKQATFMWDGEHGTYLSAYKTALEISSMLGIECRVAQLPWGTDPDSASVEEVITAYTSAEVVTRSGLIRVKLRVKA